MMRTADEIMDLVKKKAIETAKNEIIALSDEEFEALAKRACPTMVFIGLHNNNEFPNCIMDRRKCVPCWKKATGRK